MDGIQALPPALAVLLVLLGGCAAGESPPPAALPYPDPGFVEAGGYRLHYALTATQDLPSEIAGSYGIVQRRNLALLTISLRSRDGARVVANGLEATAITLTGLRQPLALTRHDSAAGPTWLATIEVRDRVPVTIEIRARAPEGPALEARFTRMLHIE
ncbi:MAG: DUF4426 domain-containing protein [Gammaproteobacteria bacterium]